MSEINAKATQDFIPFKEIRDGVIIMNDNTLRAVMLVSSTNFALKSADEQNAIIFQFQNLLNSLDFSVQIFMQSKRLDIKPYLNLLEDRYKSQTTDLMRTQVKQYIEFIRNFTDKENIMSKNFFFVVPYSPSILNSGSSVGSTLGGVFGGGSSSSKVDTNAFEEWKSQLYQRVSVVESGLSRCGVRSVLLGTSEVVELLYKAFNPGDNEKPILIN